MNYQKRVLAYIDILGFSKEIEKTINKDKEYPERIENIHNYFLKAQDLLKVNNSEVNSEIIKKFKVNHFSDSIVISYMENEEAGVFYLIIYILYICVTALKNKYLFRGAVVCGKLYHKENIIFGPALVKASNMEKEFANYPRIVLDDCILELLEKYSSIINSKTELIKIIKKLINRDFDGVYYINYFDGINYIVGDEVGLKFYFSSINSILSEMKKKNKDFKIKSKYLWLKEKYNETLSKYKNKYSNKNNKLKFPELNKYLEKCKFHFNEKDKNL